MDSPTITAQTATNSRAITPLMPETEKEAGSGARRLSRTDTLTVVSTHDSRNGPNLTDEKKVEAATTTEVNVERSNDSPSTILTGRKLFLVFVYVHVSYLISRISYLSDSLLQQRFPPFRSPHRPRSNDRRHGPPSNRIRL